MGELRRLRARRGGALAPARAWRPRADDVSRAGSRGEAARLPARGSLAHREHTEGLAPRDGIHGGSPGVATGEKVGMSVDSPNFQGLDRWAFGPRRVEKPWGWELIWAHADAYVGKILFVRSGHSLSLQFHRQKDESWYVESGRAELELGDAGQGVLNTEVI